jgi:hypothetical protein
MVKIICESRNCACEYNSVVRYRQHLSREHPRLHRKILKKELNARKWQNCDSSRPTYNELSPKSPNLQDMWDNNDVIPLPDVASDQLEDEPEPATGNLWFVEYDVDAATKLDKDDPRRFPVAKETHYPFANIEEFNLAEWFVQSGTPKTRIDTFFKPTIPKGLDPALERHSTSSYLLYKLIDKMPDGLGWDSWKDASLPSLTWTGDEYDEPIAFFYRDPLDCIKYLLRQPMNIDRLHYVARREFNDGERLYTDMYTADWWWETQKTLPRGATLVPIIAMSDGTHLSNFSGDQKAWPIYMTIGNIDRETRAKLSSHAVVLLALLPVANKLKAANEKNRSLQSEQNRYIVVEVMKVIMESLRDVGRDGVDVVCADKAVRRCFPRLAVWIADYPEHCQIQGLQYGHCMWCEKPRSGSFKAEYPKRCHAKYAQKWIDKEFQDLLAVGVNPTENALWWLPGIRLETLAVPDLLHTIYIGMVEHMMKWCISFLKKYDRMELFDRIWKTLPAYDTMTRPTKAYSEVKQWAGKDMRRFLKYMLPLFTAVLRRPSDAERQTFHEAISCVRVFTEFVYYAQYDSHTDTTLQYMDDALKRFHALVEVFASHKKSKKVAAGLYQLMKELRMERDQEIAEAKANNAKPRELAEISASHKQFMEESSQEYSRENVNFNFPKNHLMRHFTDAIRLFGTLQANSSEILETNHRFQLKKGYRASNKNKNYIAQILNYNARQEPFAVRRLNIDALRRLKDGPSSSNTENHYENADFIAVKPSLVYCGLTLKRDVATFKDLLKFIPSEVSGDDMYSCVKVLSALSSRFPDESSLWSAPASRFTSLEIPVRHFSSREWQSQTARSTGTQSWHNGPSRNDWVWVNYNEDYHPDTFRNKERAQTQKRREEAKKCQNSVKYGALRGRLPAQLMCLFKLVDPNGEVWHLALIRSTSVYQSGAVDSASGLVRVVNRTGGVQHNLKIISASRIDGCAHLVPEDPGPENRVWWVNSVIDLTTWNTIYDYDE